jgi:tetratricopeptide (TPR) repeat protein
MRLSHTTLCRLGLTVALLAPASGLANDGPQPSIPRPAPPPNMLQIPGLPPIELPPGARAFGPNGPMGAAPAQEAPRTAPEAQRPTRPSPPSARATEEARKAEPPRKRSDINVADTRQKFLEELFQRLEKSGDEEEAKGIAGAIERVWLRSGSDTSDLLMGRAVSAFQTKDYALAIELLDKVVVLDPDWSEAWNKRATAKYFAEDFSGAMADIGIVLKLEPRHFGALAGMGFILQKSGFERRALEVFRKALAVYPQLTEVKKQVDQLAIEIEGRDI